MDIIFYKPIFDQIYDDKVKNLLSEEGLEKWQEAKDALNLKNTSPKLKKYKKLADDRFVNSKKGKIENFFILWALGTGQSSGALRKKVKQREWKHKDSKILSTIDELFLSETPVYLNITSFIEFLNYSGSVYLSNNKKIIVYAALKHNAFDEKHAITTGTVLSEIRKVSPKIYEKLGAQKIEKLLTKINILKSNDDKYYIDLEKTIKDFNSYRYYPNDKNKKQPETH